MTLRLSALFEDRVQTLLSLSNARKTRKKKPNSRSGGTNEFHRTREIENSGKSPLANNATVTTRTQNTSLRLVLRRSSDHTESFGRSLNVETPGSSSTADSARSDRTSPKRTGIAINLRTGRARELSDENVSHGDSDGITAAASIQSKGSGVYKKKKIKRRITVPREYIYGRATRRDTRTNENTVSTTRAECDGDIHGKRAEEKTAVYGTRSGRRIHSKRFGLTNDSEKENKEENGVEIRRRRRKRKEITGECFICPCNTQLDYDGPIKCNQVVKFSRG